MYSSGASDRGAAKALRVFREVEEESSPAGEVRAMLSIGRNIVAFHQIDFDGCYRRALAVEAQRDQEGLPLLHREITTISFHSTMSLTLAGRYREAHAAGRRDKRPLISRHMRSGFISHASPPWVKTKRTGA
ncbi:MAG: hypothetical protein ACI9KE_000331 [Polyangiales bacterium]|jgi:hypothetical protein